MENLKFVVVGHVDHGKSTLIGRLLMDTDSLAPSLIEKVKNICKEQGKEFEHAFLLDAFQEEQEQGITIDTTKIEFSTPNRHYTIIDAPGHKEFLKNMVSGATNAEAAILLIDAEEGIQQQTMKHAYLLALIGIKQVIVIVNKMDLVNYAKERFDVLEKGIREYLAKLQIFPSRCIPVSSKLGDNLIQKSSQMQWYQGPTLLKALDTFQKEKSLEDKPLRFPIQDIYKFDNKRIIAGRLESGAITVGDEITVYPSNKHAKVVSIESWNEEENDKRVAGECIGITLDEEYFLKRGELISTSKPLISKYFTANIFWLGKNDLTTGKTYTLKLATQETDCKIFTINKVIDAETLESIPQKNLLSKNDIGKVVIETKDPLVFDAFHEIPTMGRFVLMEKLQVAGGGIIEKTTDNIKARNIVWQQGQITKQQRAEVLGCKNKVLWFTGLSGSGKSTVAQELEKKLYEKGIVSYVLDGDNIRHGLNNDLGFSPEARKENIRRVGEVAKLFYDAGIFVVVCFISPYKEDRDRVRNFIGDDFVEVFVKCSLEECEKRDKKGLYEKARRGEIKDFTGIHAPYEEPQNPELVINTEENTAEECADKILNLIISP